MLEDDVEYSWTREWKQIKKAATDLIGAVFAFLFLILIGLIFIGLIIKVGEWAF